MLKDKLRSIFAPKPLAKKLAEIFAAILVAPPSYRYHSLLNGLLGVLNRRLISRSIGLYGNNTRHQFASGAVFEYKTVVRNENNALQINRKLAASRINEIFLAGEILEHLNIVGDGSLLEIGCEAGQNLSIIQEALPGMSLNGCDISEVALSTAAGFGFAVKQVDLLDIDGLGIYEDNQFDYILVSHVFEHLVRADVGHSLEIRNSMLKHIHRIARLGYVITTPLISSEVELMKLMFLGHSRIALLASPAEALCDMGIHGFFVKYNQCDTSISVVVRK